MNDLRIPGLSIAEMQHIIRTLSDESIWDLTSVSDPSKWDALRRAMFAWVLDCGSKSTEETLFTDFMWDVDIAHTLALVKLHPVDIAHYLHTFDMLYPSEVILVHVGQCFSRKKAYLCAWFTCVSKEGNYFWVGVDLNWDTHAFYTIAEFHEWLISRTPQEYYYYIYQYVQDWPRVFVGGTLNIPD